MSPACAFNRDEQYAFVLESLDANESYAHYSDQPEEGLDRGLAPLLHNNKALNPKTTNEDYATTPNVRRIIERANQLNEKNVLWHHRMLYTKRIFNLHAK